MQQNSETDGLPASQNKKRHGRILRRLLKTLAWVVGGVVVLCILCCVALNLYLTPKRLADIAADYAGKYLDADIKVGKVSFTMWSTFPHFELKVDSAMVISRRLSKLPTAKRDLLPEDCDTLASFISLSGSIEPLKLIHNRIALRHLNIKGLRLNLVALNDSVNNFDILPSKVKDKPFVMPRFEAGHISFTDLRPVTYYSAATQASALIDLSHASMTERRKDSYSLRLQGKFNLAVQKLHLLRGFPFAFSGKMDVKFRPFRLIFDRYNIALGNVRSQVDLSLQLGDNNSQLTAMRYSISAFNLMRLFEYLPAEKLPHLKAITSNATLEATARLTAPYKFSSEALPSFKIDFRIPEAWLKYSLSTGDITVHNIGLAASLDFDGKDINSSRFSLQRLSLEAPGVKAALRGNVRYLFTNPTVEADLTASADLGRLMALIPGGSWINLKGNLSSHVTTAFPISLVSQDKLGDIPIRGNVSLHDIAYKSPEMSLTGSGADITFGQLRHRIAIHAVVPDARFSSDGGCDIAAKKLKLALSTPGINRKAPVSLKGSIGALEVAGAGYDLQAKGIAVNADANFALLQGISSAGLPVDLRVGVTDAKGIAAADSVTMAAENIAIRGNLHDMKLTAAVKGDRLRYSDPVNFALLNTLSTHLNLILKGVVPRENKGRMVALLDLLKPDGSLKAEKGCFVSVAYPAVTHLGTLDLDFSPQAFSLNRLRLYSQRNALNLTGTITNYRSLLPHRSGNKIGKVKADLTLSADTIDINQIAGTCRAGQLLLAAWKGVPPAPEMPVDTGPTPSDFRPMLLPTWLQASMMLKAKEVNYTNLHVRDVLAAMRLDNGIFNLDSIHARTDFGSAHASAMYAGADSLKMGVRCNVALDTINVVTFFQRFHTLLEMMPEMKNLSGNVSVSADGQFSLFPDMVMNLPSLTATVTASGRDLTVHQNKFIHTLCRHLLIHTRKDLHIRDMDVRATIHDNQLELYPFIFEVNRYKLRVTGENDFAGNLRYHIGVLHSPVPFRFGVNIDGTFSDYHIRIGGSLFRQNRAMHDMRLLQKHRINLMEELKWLGAKFMQKAAESDTGTEHVPFVNACGERMTDVHDRILLPDKSADMLPEYRKSLRQLRKP